MVGLPERIGRYRIERVIGAGGFATVYQARDERLDASVAIKILAENHCLDPDVRERFLKEGRVLRRIGSPHVVAIHDLGETERGQPYLVLDHADRGTLAERSRSRRAAGWTPGAEDVRYVAGALADSLGAVHAAEIVHRDLAPRNLLVRSTRSPGGSPPCQLLEGDERLLLADLGLSKDLAVASGLTIAGGTAGYTPPEQREGPAQVDARADVWAASALMVWLLLDRPPDDAGSWQGGLADGPWPPSLVRAMARGLEASPVDRFPSIGDWHDALADALEPTAVTVPAPDRSGVTDPATAPTAIGSADAADAAEREPGNESPAATPTLTRADERAGRPRRRRLVAAGALLAAAAVVAGALLSWRAGGDDGPQQTVEDLGEGRVQVGAEAGDRRVAVSGPEELTVGQTQTFEAETSGVEHWVWYGPDGGIHPDADQIEVTGSTPGRATVRLQGVDSQNQVVEAVLELTVVEAE
ncbi:MAG: serine/threonine-protein kinase [Acidimicrobiales bacterium]